MALSVPRTYAELLRRVQATLFAGQREIEFAWVRTYHETGRLIHRHVLLEKRADYGAQVIHRLAQDTGASERRLYECRQFYRCFPILRQVAELGWNRGRLLAQISDPAERNTLAAAAVKHDWPSAEVVQRVRSLNAAAATSAAASPRPPGRNSPAPSSRCSRPRRAGSPSPPRRPAKSPRARTPGWSTPPSGRPSGSPPFSAGNDHEDPRQLQPAGRGAPAAPPARK